jgi:hypothetical protein
LDSRLDSVPCLTWLPIEWQRWRWWCVCASFIQVRFVRIYFVKIFKC